MGADAQFFRLLTTFCDGSVSTRVLKSSPWIIVGRPLRGLIFEAKISGTKFRKPTSNSAFINTIITKCLVNFSNCFAALWFNLNPLRKIGQKSLNDII